MSQGRFAVTEPHRFLVTTSRSLLLLDVRTRTYETIHTGQGLYYGIDVGEDDILVAARNRLVSSPTKSDSERGDILVFDRQLRFRGTLPTEFPLRDLHQIRRHAGVLYVTASFDNVIAIYDQSRWSQWLPLARPTTAPWDVNHFNTIEFLHGSLCVVAHNKGASEILMYDPHTLALHTRFALGHQAHNLWKCADEWITCSSGEGCLVGTAGFRLQTGGFPRGLWVGSDFSVVGVSERAERIQRDYAHGELRLFDHTWQELDRLPLPYEGLVLDIAPL